MKKNPQFGELLGRKSDSVNAGFGLFEIDARDFPQMLGDWIAYENCGQNMVDFLQKTDLRRVISDEQFTAIYLEKMTPSPLMARTLSLHLPGYGLRRNEPAMTRFGMRGFQSKASQWRETNQRLPQSEITLDAFRGWVLDVLGTLVEKSRGISENIQAGGENAIENPVEESSYDRLIQHILRLSPEGTECDEETIRARLTTSYKNDPLTTSQSLFSLLQGTGVDAQEADVEDFLKNLGDTPKIIIISPAATALGFLRQSRGLSQREVAKAIGKYRNIISLWETNSRLIDASELPAISAAIGLTRDEKRYLTYLVLPALDATWLATQPEEEREWLLRRALRRCVGITGKALEEKTGKRQFTNSDWETVSRRVDAFKITGIGTELGLTTEEEERIIQLVLPALDATWLAEQPRRDRTGFLFRDLCKCVGITDKALEEKIRRNRITISYWTIGFQIDPSALADISAALELTKERERELAYLVLPPLDPTQLVEWPEEERAGMLLQALCKRAGVKDEALRKRIGISRAAFSRWERGLDPIDASKVPDISAMLGLTTEEEEKLRTQTEQSNNAIREKGTRHNLHTRRGRSASDGRPESPNR